MPGKAKLLHNPAPATPSHTSLSQKRADLSILRVLDSLASSSLAPTLARQASRTLHTFALYSTFLAAALANRNSVSSTHLCSGRGCGACRELHHTCEVHSTVYGDGLTVGIAYPRWCSPQAPASPSGCHDDAQKHYQSTGTAHANVLQIVLFR